MTTMMLRKGTRKEYKFTSVNLGQRKIEALEFPSPASNISIEYATYPRTICYPYSETYDGSFVSKVEYYADSEAKTPCTELTESVESLYNSELPFVSAYDAYIRKHLNINNKKDKILYEHIESLKWKQNWMKI